MSIELYIKNERSLYIDTIEKLYKQIICEIIKNNKYIDKIYIKKARKKKKENNIYDMFPSHHPSKY